jgi:Putative zinc-finger
MSVNYDSHLGEELLERYSRGTLQQADVERVEEHVLVCESCQNKLDLSDSWVRSMRRTGAQARPEIGNTWVGLRWPRLVPALAAAVVVLFGAGLVLKNQQRGQVPFAIALQATRGENVPQVPARQPLVIQPNLEGLPQFSEYRLEIVDQAGKKVREAAITADPTGTPKATVPGIASGTYFVRIYSPAGELLREYALEARDSR